MLSNTVLNFLSELDQNNNKPWFDANRKKYEAAKADFENFTEAVRVSLLPILPGLEDKKAKQLTFRIFRDVRFSKNKNPYKNNFGAAFSNGAKGAHNAGYYLHIQPGASFWAAGIWEPAAPDLKAIRQEIDYNFKEFNDIVTAKDFVKSFGKLDTSSQLKRPPQDYDAGNPAIEYLKLKSFTTGIRLDDKMLTGKQSVEKITSYAHQLKPFVDFIDRALEQV